MKAFCLWLVFPLSQVVCFWMAMIGVRPDVVYPALLYEHLLFLILTTLAFGGVALLTRQVDNLSHGRWSKYDIGDWVLSILAVLLIVAFVDHARMSLKLIPLQKEFSAYAEDRPSSFPDGHPEFAIEDRRKIADFIQRRDESLRQHGYIVIGDWYAGPLWAHFPCLYVRYPPLTQRG